MKFQEIELFFLYKNPKLKVKPDHGYFYKLKYQNENILKSFKV